MILLGRDLRVGLLDSPIFCDGCTWFIFVCRGAEYSSMTPIGAPQPIYSKNPADPWNRIFNVLFSRRIKIHLSDQFPEGVAPLSTAFRAA